MNRFLWNDSLLQQMSNGFVHYKVITKEQNHPVDYEIIHVNEAFGKLMKRLPSQMTGISFNQVMYPFDCYALYTHFSNVFRTGVANSFEQFSPLLAKWFLIHVYVSLPGYLSSLFVDITPQKAREQETAEKYMRLKKAFAESQEKESLLQAQLDQIANSFEKASLGEAQFKTLVNHSSDMIYGCDRDGILTTVNQKFCLEMGVAAEGAIGSKMNGFLHDEHYREKWSLAFHSVIYTAQPILLEDEYLDQFAKRHYFTEQLSPVVDHHGEVIGITGSRHDVTDTRKNEKMVRYMAYHDSLTGLPNRTLFTERLNMALSVSSRFGKRVGVAFLDLDNFKSVNDTLGHSVGDEVLIETAQRIKSSIRVFDTVARLSGDEFLILIHNVDEVGEITEILGKINEIIESPYVLQDNIINLSASIGVAVYPYDGDTMEELIKNADTAMYKAKDRGKNCSQLFNKQMKDELIKKVNIEKLLRVGLENKEFVLHYQPQFHAKTGKLRGFEALLRWNSPELGFMNPMEFIPLAEESGLIVPIGKWVVNEAAQALARLEAQYGLELIMSVNISPIQLGKYDFYDMILEAIRIAGIAPSHLELEVTETSFINSFGPVQLLKDLQKRGVRVALDDFGTGYSSLSYLKKLPIDLLKIDKAFIREIDGDQSQPILTDSIISLVHKLNIETLAEGVENQAQLDFLLQAECDNVQGFYFGKPVPEAEMGIFIKGADRSIAQTGG